MRTNKKEKQAIKEALIKKRLFDNMTKKFYSLSSKYKPTNERKGNSND